MMNRIGARVSPRWAPRSLKAGVLQTPEGPASSGQSCGPRGGAPPSSAPTRPSAVVARTGLAELGSQRVLRHVVRVLLEHVAHDRDGMGPQHVHDHTGAEPSGVVGAD